MDVGARIASWRKAKGLSQRELADAVGVTPATIYQWEGTGRSRTNPTLTNLEAVARALGVTMARFFGVVPRAGARS